MPVATFPPQFHPTRQETNQAVVEAAGIFGLKVYLVGGYIRDALLGRMSEAHPPKDFDYTVLGGQAIGFGKRLADRLGANFVLLDQELDTCRVVLASGVQVDLAGCIGGELTADLHRRDFTINALAWDPERPEEIIDTESGIEDLRNKTVRVIAEGSLTADPLRLLRAFRFAAALDFNIEENTFKLVRKHSRLLQDVAAERVSYELFAIMETERAGAAIKHMAETELLEIVFPELSACHRVPKNAYHHLGLFDHSIQVLVETELACAQLPDWARDSFRSPVSHQTTRLGATKLAALLHDIGKPDTWAVRDDGKHTFIGHDKLGAEMIEDTAKRLKWSRPLERLVASLVRWHLRPGALFHQGPPTERALYRFYRDMGPELPQLIALALGDFRSTNGPGLQEGRDLLENQLLELLDAYAVEGSKSGPPLFNGNDVMRVTGSGQGPFVGQILEELKEAQALGLVNDRQQAESFVLKIWREKYSK